MRPARREERVFRDAIEPFGTKTLENWAKHVTLDEAAQHGAVVQIAAHQSLGPIHKHGNGHQQGSDDM